MNQALLTQEAEGMRNALAGTLERQLMWSAQVEAASWRRVAERRVRVGVAYVACFVCLVFGLCMGIVLAGLHK